MLFVCDTCCVVSLWINPAIPPQTTYDITFYDISFYDISFYDITFYDITFYDITLFATVRFL